MTKQTWIIAAILSAGLLLGLFFLNASRRAGNLAELQSELASLTQSNDLAMAEIARLSGELEAIQKTNELLFQEKEEAANSRARLEEKMRAAVESRDVTISELQGKLTVNILDRILFDLGEAVLKPQGEQVLSQIAKVLDQYPDRQVQIIGHTDNLPIRASSRARYSSNWELSTARALAAVRYLIDKAGVAPGRLAAVGQGEFRPIAENDTPEGRARNRRITLVVLADPLQGLEKDHGKEKDPAKPSTQPAEVNP